MNVLLTQYLSKKICFKCKLAQSKNRTYCFKKSCRGELRARRPYKRR